MIPHEILALQLLKLMHPKKLLTLRSLHLEKLDTISDFIRNENRDFNP
jgi:hypothetical protein